LPVRASTKTCNLLGAPLASAPVSTVSYASLGVPHASTTRRGAVAESTLASFARATEAAFAAVTFAVVSTEMVAVWAAVVARRVPAVSVTTTASPPTTARPRYVRS
jgi:hypothetical protein